MFRRKPKNLTPRSRQSPSKGAEPVFSYYQNRVIPEQNNVSTKSVKSRASTKPSQLANILTFLILIVCMGYILSIDTKAKVIVVNEQDRAAPSELRSVEVYEEAAQKLLQSSPLSYTKLTLNTDGLSKALTDEFPELSRATVTLPLINRRPIIYLEPAHPAYVLANQTGLYVIDEQGRALTKVDQQGTKAPSKLPTITDEANQPVELDKQTIPVSYVDFMREVQTQLANKQIQVSAFTLPNVPNQLLVKVANQPYYIKFTFSGDARLQSGTFLSLKQKLDADKVVPAEYIDVRVDERAYYK